MFDTTVDSTWFRAPTLPPVLKRFFFKRSSCDVIEDFQNKFMICKSFAHKLQTERNGLIYYLDASTSPSYSPQSGADSSILDRRLTISGLRLDTVHTGCYLLCRVFSGSYQLATVNFLVIDPEESIEHVSLEINADPSMTSAENLSNRACVPKGTLLVIRNPFYTTRADGNVLISIQNPQELLIVHERHALAVGVEWIQSKYPSAHLKAHHRQQKMEQRAGNLPEMQHRTRKGQSQKPDLNAKLLSNTGLTMYSSPSAGSAGSQQTGYYDGTPKARSSVFQAGVKPLNPLLQRIGRKKPSRKNLNVRFEENDRENGPWPKRRPMNHEILDTDTAVLVCCLIFFVWLFFYASYFM